VFWQPDPIHGPWKKRLRRSPCTTRTHGTGILSQAVTCVYVKVGIDTPQRLGHIRCVRVAKIPGVGRQWVPTIQVRTSRFTHLPILALGAPRGLMCLGMQRMIPATDSPMREYQACPQSLTCDPEIPRTAREWKCKRCGATVLVIPPEGNLPPKLAAHELRGTQLGTAPSTRAGSGKRRDKKRR
jgi:hypothetical protein